MRLPVNRTLPLLALLFVSACGGGARVADVPPPAPNGPAADYPMVLGSPFTVDGVTYTPVDTLNYDAVGSAGTGSEGGEAISAAHRTLPLPSYVEVTALDSGRTILVRLERRGPMAGKHVIELSPGAAAQLGLTGGSQTGVRVRRVNPPEADRALLRVGQQAPARMDTPKSLLTVLQRKLDQQNGVTPPPAAATIETTASQGPAQLPPPKPTAKTPAGSLPKPAPAKAEPAAKLVPPVTKVAPPKDVPARSALAKGTHVIQVGAFSSKANAETAARAVGGQVSPSGKLWRVRVGPFADEAGAKPALAKVQAAGYKDARIQRDK